MPSLNKAFKNHNYIYQIFSLKLKRILFMRTFKNSIYFDLKLYQGCQSIDCIDTVQARESDPSHFIRRVLILFHNDPFEIVIEYKGTLPDFNLSVNISLYIPVISKRLFWTYRIIFHTSFLARRIFFRTSYILFGSQSVFFGYQYVSFGS